METYKHITIVDTNNISRSFMVEVVLNQLISERENCDMSVISRGLIVLFPEPVSAKVADLVRGQGYEIKNFQSEQLTEEDIQNSDLILTITEEEKQKLYDEFHPTENQHIDTIKGFSGEEVEIIDPYGQEMEVYEQCFLTLKHLSEIIFKKIIEQ